MYVLCMYIYIQYMYIPDASCFFESGFILFHNVDSLLLNEKSLRLQGFSRACACMEYRSGGVSVTLQFLGLQHPTGQNLPGYPRGTPWGCLNFWEKKQGGLKTKTLRNTSCCCPRCSTSWLSDQMLTLVICRPCHFRNARLPQVLKQKAMPEYSLEA